MENFYNRIRNFILPLKNKVRIAIFSFSKKERRLFLFFLFILLISTIVLLEKVNKNYMVNVPIPGGSISEGIIGSPRFVNPVLAYSLVDNDLVSIVYSGLMRKNTDGTLIPDLAEKYEISKDGLTYTFTLRDKIFFHDEVPITASDIIFTLNKIKDPTIKSPEKVNWDGVNVEKIDEKTIVFYLKQPYASFLENTTIGILPMHLWGDAPETPIEMNDLNTNPIGSGPYKIEKIKKGASGSIDSYGLTFFKKFTLGKPYIKNLTFNFYPNEDDLVSALLSGEVKQVSSITPEKAIVLKEKKYNILSSVLPRVFGLFFNQNKNQLFTDKNIITAINLAIDKDKIIREILLGYGVVINDPIPQNMVAYQKLREDKKYSLEDNLARAQSILTKDGWKLGEDGILEKTIKSSGKKTSIQKLEFSISTGNTPEIAKSAELIKQNLNALGMKVDVKTFEIGNLNQSVIRPREYDALLFGQIINHESDLFAFWHSSQRKDPGLNIAMYTNAKVDKILEDAFTLTDEISRIKKYAQFEDEIRKDTPAVFLYSPNFIYVTSKNLKGISIDHIIAPADRFLNIYSWYLKTDNVWRIFSKQN
jgi:peptide/nickel transport system substrate-binding protein